MKFSVVCLTYKRVELLEEAVFSVLQQTHKQWEMLIINDCPDQTIIFNHPQIKIFNLQEKFKSIADKRNFGKANTKGDFIINLDDDDLFLPTYLENLDKMVSKTDWLMIQRPIIYWNDVNKIVLSPVPQANTFVYSREISKQFNYEFDGKDELTPFFHKTQNNAKCRKLYYQLKPEQCGYVWRQDVDTNRKYSLNVLFKKEPSIERQDAIMRLIPNKKGTFILQPKWKKDYTTIIKTNMKIVDPAYVLKQHRGLKEFYDQINEMAQKFNQKGANGIENLPTPVPIDDNWTKVKPTWANAIKFLEAVKSRGVVATVLDVAGADKSAGDRVSEEVYIQRKLSCFGDVDKNIPKCERLKEIPGRGFFCGGCGCGNSDLARLDSDTSEEYNKLHYPYLECPMQKKGFSNYEKSYIKTQTDIPLTIIIPVLNDNDELNATIESIRATSPESVEIIVIDDQSDFPVYVVDKKTKLVRTETRLGVGGTRHLGATMASAPYLLFIDSHMRFEENWFNNSLKRLISTDHNVVWCGVCLGLEEGHMDINFHKGAYHGARLALYEEKENQVFEGKWVPEQDGEDYEISCLMGACYFFHKSWFFHIGGTRSLKMWGSDEPFLSVKTYLAGGSIKLMKDVKIGHKFRNVASYTTQNSYILYNKLRSMKMVFSDELYDLLKSKIPEDENKLEALRMIEQDKEEIQKERDYYKGIFIRDEKWLREKFSINV